MDPHSQEQGLEQDPAQSPDQVHAGAKKKFGCSGYLVVIFGALLLGYILIFQTSIPIKMIAGSIAKNTLIDGRPLKIDGVSGSLSRGVRIKKIVIPGKQGDSTITDLAFKYKKPMRWFTRGQVTITEISSSSAEFIVSNDFFDDDPSEEAYPEDAEEQTSNLSGEGFFDLKLMKFENTRLRTVDGSVDIDIPLIQMEDLYIDKDEFKIAKFEITSNMLSASLAKGGKAELDGKGVSFDQKIEFRIKPDIHESVTRDIPVDFEFGMNQGASISRISGFDGALEQIDFADGRSLVRFNDFSPNDYMNFEGHVMPEDLNMTAVEKDDQVSLDAGSFRIGQTTFRFDAREFESSEDESMGGTAKVGPYEVTAMIRPDKSDKAWPPMRVDISSKPEAPRQEILAQLYHGTDYASLEAEQKAAIDRLNIAKPDPAGKD